MSSKRDIEIASSVLSRIGLHGIEHRARLIGGADRQTRQSYQGEVHWIYRYETFEGGGCFWPELPESLDPFIEALRLHTWGVFYDETCEWGGIKVDDDATPYEKHFVSPFAIDLSSWSICLLDEALYLARRRHESSLERWFAGFPSPKPSAQSLDGLTRGICLTHELPYPGPMTLSALPLYPRPRFGARRDQTRPGSTATTAD